MLAGRHSHRRRNRAASACPPSIVHVRVEHQASTSCASRCAESRRSWRIGLAGCRRQTASVQCPPICTLLTFARPAHGSGPMRIATPLSQRTCTTYSLPASRRTCVKNSTRKAMRLTLKRSTSQIARRSTIAIAARVKVPPKRCFGRSASKFFNRVGRKEPVALPNSLPQSRRPSCDVVMLPITAVGPRPVPAAGQGQRRRRAAVPSPPQCAGPGPGCRCS